MNYLFLASSICLLVGWVFVISIVLKLNIDKGQNFSNIYIFVMAVIPLVAMLLISPYGNFSGLSFLFGLPFAIAFTMSGLSVVISLFIIASGYSGRDKDKVLYTNITLIITVVSLLFATIIWVDRFVK